MSREAATAGTVGSCCRSSPHPFASCAWLGAAAGLGLPLFLWASISSFTCEVRPSSSQSWNPPSTCFPQTRLSFPDRSGLGTRENAARARSHGNMPYALCHAGNNGNGLFSLSGLMEGETDLANLTMMAKTQVIYCKFDFGSQAEAHSETYNCLCPLETIPTLPPWPSSQPGV